MAASCKEAVGWMFARLDTSGDLFLEAAELAAINLDKYEVCIRSFFNSCDTSRDGRVSVPEWCFCFWRESASCRGRGCMGGVGGLLWEWERRLWGRGEAHSRVVGTHATGFGGMHAVGPGGCTLGGQGVCRLWGHGDA